MCSVGSKLRRREAGIEGEGVGADGALSILEAKGSDQRAALWLSPQGVSSFHSRPRKCPGQGLAWTGKGGPGGGTLPGQPGKGRREWPP